MLGLLKKIKNHDREKLTAVESVAEIGDISFTDIVEMMFGLITLVIALSLCDLSVMFGSGVKKVLKRRKTDKKTIIKCAYCEEVFKGYFAEQRCNHHEIEKHWGEIELRASVTMSLVAGALTESLKAVADLPQEEFIKAMRGDEWS